MDNFLSSVEKVLLLVIVSCVSVSFSTPATNFEPSSTLKSTEVCSDNPFKISCGDENQVILVETSAYGRRYPGKCVTEKIDEDCEVSIKEWVASKCSGKPSCDFTLTKTDAYLKKQEPCSTQLTWNLYTTYRCVQVENQPSTTCPRTNVSPHTYPTTSDPSSGYIVSSLARPSPTNPGTKPGDPKCPWIISVKTGQKIQLFAYNFLLPLPVHTYQDCNYFGKVKEGESNKPLNVCYNDVSPKLVYTSETNTIHFHFEQNVIMNNSIEYLVQYKAIGCADMPKLVGAHFQRTGKDNNDLIVKCNHSGETWFLTCDGTQWKGKLVNCSGAGVKSGNHARTNSNKNGWTVINDGSFPYGLVLVVAIGVALGILLGGTTLIIISYRWKRKFHQPHYELPPETCLNYNSASSLRGIMGPGNDTLRKYNTTPKSKRKGPHQLMNAPYTGISQGVAGSPGGMVPTRRQWPESSGNQPMSHGVSVPIGVQPAVATENITRGPVGNQQHNLKQVGIISSGNQPIGGTNCNFSSNSAKKTDCNVTPIGCGGNNNNSNTRPSHLYETTHGGTVIS